MFLKINPIPLKKRMKEIAYDYLFILCYLIGLFVLAMIFYSIVFRGIPEMEESAVHLVATMTSVLPIIFIFSYLDFTKNGSFGKRKAGLQVVYQKKTIGASLLRNVVKFIPWQLGHMGTIHGMYSEEPTGAIFLSVTSILSALVLFSVATYRKDKRHLGDFIAQTQVQDIS